MNDMRGYFLNIIWIRNFIAIGCCVVFTLMPVNVQGQNVEGPYELKWLIIGDLQSWFSNAGTEIEYGRRGRSFLQDQTDLLRWPGQYTGSDYNTSHGAAKSIRIGLKNFTDPATGDAYPVKVVQSGPRAADLLHYFIPVDFRMLGKYDFGHPQVIVDGLEASRLTVDDEVDGYDPALSADRLLINTNHTAVGVTVTRKIYQFSNQYHDDYYIYDYVFKNTGVYDSEGNTHNQTLEDVWFHFQYRYAFAFEAFRRGWTAGGNISWGKNTVNEVIGQDPTAADFRFRAQYSWYGPHSQAQGGYEGDWGAPNYTNPAPLGEPAFTGVVTLHADKSATDKSDNLEQPRTTQFTGSDRDAQTADQYSKDIMTQQYDIMTAGHPDQTHAEQVGNSFADQWGDDPGGYSQGQGFGPYTLAPGDSIRIVLGEAVAGLSRRKSLEVAENWFYNRAPFTLPDGSTTQDRNEYKKAWVWTAEDSLFQAFERAIDAYENGYQVTDPPPPPDRFIVSSAGDRILLEWGDNASDWDTFDGYRVYRAVERPDTTYEMIFSCDKEKVVHSFEDVTAQRGVDYYYFVQTKDDGSTNSIEPGVPLVSSRYYTMTSQPANLKRPYSSEMENIQVVPNPFSIKARDLQFGGIGTLAQDRIMFFGLPPVCDIKIFTERGDLVNTIHHDDYTGDEPWHLKTSSGQIIVSGLYIAHFEIPEDISDSEGNLIYREGQSTYRKFIVIR